MINRQLSGLLREEGAGSFGAAKPTRDRGKMAILKKSWVSMLVC
jgi:hypothetical protein